jgi:hypothetical protein
VGADSSARFGGMTHSESPSLHAILKDESPSEDESTSSEGESYGLPLLRVRSTVIPIGVPHPYTTVGGDLSIPGSSSKCATNHYINKSP